MLQTDSGMSELITVVLRIYTSIIIPIVNE